MVGIAQCPDLTSIRLLFWVAEGTRRDAEDISRVVRSLRQLPKLRTLVLGIRNQGWVRIHGQSYSVAIEDAILELDSLRAVELITSRLIKQQTDGKWVLETHINDGPLRKEYPRLHAKGILTSKTV